METHSTVFQLRAFGELRLPAPAAAAVVRHLATGCRACRAEVAPWLLPWLDEAPAAEARATDAARCGPALAAEYGRAARRVARAAARQRADDAAGAAGTAGAADREVLRVARLLDGEGPAAIGRLPRHLQGRPAVAALLRQIVRRGNDHPHLRLRLAEMAWDLASRLPGAERQLPAIAVEAGLELANAYRVVGRFGVTRGWLDRMAEEVSSRPCGPRLRTRIAELEAMLCIHLCRDRAARGFARQAAAARRRAGEPAALARAATLMGLSYYRDADRAEPHNQDALRLCDPQRTPAAVHQVAIINLVVGQVWRGDWVQAGALLHGYGLVLAPLERGKLAAASRWLTGLVDDREGRPAAALHAFAAARATSAAIGDRFREAVMLVSAGACLERHGDPARAHLAVVEAAAILQEGQPHRELDAAATLLRTRGHFSSLRAALPLDRVLHYLDFAEFDQEVRLHSFLG